MNKKLTVTAIVPATVAILATGAIGIGGVANAQDNVDRNNYTTLDHPAMPCRISVVAVANWGETSAHLPQACIYE